MVLPALAAGARASAGAAMGTTRAPMMTGGRMAGSNSPTLVQKPSRASLSNLRRPAAQMRNDGTPQRPMSRAKALLGRGRGQAGGGVTYRIDRPTMIVMLGIALLFDVGQLACKALYLVGLTLVGAAAGGAIAGEIGISSEIGAATGGVVGAVATAFGVGVVINILLAEALTWVLMVVGFSSMWLWFALKGVPVLGGDYMGRKFGTLTLGVLIEFVPMVNVVPAVTWWTFTMASLSRMEDRKKHAGAAPTSEAKVAVNDDRKVANDNEPMYAYGT